ncbi:MAG TPA: rhodanese-like domain-containing protein [Thermoanaerobaculia bacterium]|nr:rhodanese-like domain-containing protein [Thermoanaerobaculia bacterium]
MNNAADFYRSKLEFEIDGADVYEAMNNGEPIVVVDARRSEFYERAHVPGAINFPHREMNEESVQRLPKDKLIVTYCDGLGCNASTKAALKLTTFGFRVKEMPGGMDWWIRDGHPIARGAEVTTGAIACGC